MQAAKPFVQRHIAFPEIDVVIAVMQIVHVAIVLHGLRIAEHDFVKAGMAYCRPQASLKGVEHHVQRVTGYDDMDQYTAEVQQVFHRMHGHSRPGADIHVLVVKVMHTIVEWFPMYQAMNPVEMEITPEGDQRHGQAEPDGVRFKIDIR